jgi:hypothetical protein
MDRSTLHLLASPLLAGESYKVERKEGKEGLEKALIIRCFQRFCGAITGA